MRTALGVAALGAASICMAGSGSGTLGVNIALTTGSSTAPAASGVCISQTLSQENGAVVRVVCDSAQFVSISPLPGGRFAGTHGGAYSYHFGSSFRDLAGSGEFANGAGSIAAFRVFGLTERDGRIDMLVSF